MKQKNLNKQCLFRTPGRYLFLLGLFFFTMTAAQAAPPTPEVTVYNGATKGTTYNFTSANASNKIQNFAVATITKIVVTGTWNNAQLYGLYNAIHNKVGHSGNGPGSSYLLEADLSAITVNGDVADGFYMLFENCSNLTTVKFPTKTTNYAVSFHRTFYGSSKLTTVTNLENFTKVSTFYMTFHGCRKLLGVTLPNGSSYSSVSFEGTFWYCESLVGKTTDVIKNLTAFNNVSTFKDTFYGCEKLTEITLPSGTNQASVSFESTFGGCRGLIGKTTDVIKNLTTFKNVSTFVSTFRSCDKLTEITLPPGTNQSSISFSLSFSGCTGLTGKSTDAIKNLTAFDNVSSFSSAFWGTNLMEITLPVGTDQPSINFSGAFGRCRKLTNIVNLELFTKNVSLHGAFDGSFQLTHVYLGTTPITNFEGVFYTSFSEDGYVWYYDRGINPNMLIYLPKDVDRAWLPVPLDEVVEPEDPGETGEDLDPFIYFLMLWDGGDMEHLEALAVELEENFGFSHDEFNNLYNVVKADIEEAVETGDSDKMFDIETYVDYLIGEGFFTTELELFASEAVGDRIELIHYFIQMYEQLNFVQIPVPYFHCNIIIGNKASDNPVSYRNIELIDYLSEVRHGDIGGIEFYTEEDDYPDGFPYHCPIAFTLAEGAVATYTRSFSGQLSSDGKTGWQSIMLPFTAVGVKGASAITACGTGSNEGYMFAAYVGSEPTTGNLNFEASDNIVANQPHLVLISESLFDTQEKADSVRFVSAPGISIPATPTNLSVADASENFTYTGTFRAMPATADSHHYLTGNDTFTQGEPNLTLRTGNGIPFRAYFAAESGAPATAELLIAGNIIGDCHNAIYVDHTATEGANNGTSWADAYLEMADAVQYANNPDNGVTHILVAAGEYEPNYNPYNMESTEMLDALDAMSGFGLEEAQMEAAIGALETFYFNRSGLTVLGGYDNGLDDDGTDYINDYQRDAKTYKTVLRGHQPTVIADVILLTSFHVVLTYGLDDTFLLDGFTITGGITDPALFGGGSFPLKEDVDTSIKSMDGGGIYNVNSSPVMNNVLITTNSGFGSSGGGMYNENSSPVLTNSVFSGNSAKYGAAMDNNNSSPVFTNVIFTDNSASEGGVMYNHSDSRTTFINVLIYNNGDWGEIINSSGSSLVFTNVTMVTSDYSSICINNHSDGGSMQFNNSILWTEIEGNLVSFNNCLVKDRSGAGIISNEDPLFVDADNGDYRLQGCSPAINVGSNALFEAATDFTIDLDGEDRVYDGKADVDIIDLGAYEYQGEWAACEVPGVTLDLKVLLEGPSKADGTMNNYLQVPDEDESYFEECVLPKLNPYGVSDVVYNDIANPTGTAKKVVDWIKVEIVTLDIDEDMGEYSYNVLETKALLLQPTGDVVDIDGKSPLFEASSLPVHIMVWHRNHLPIISQEISSFNSNTIYDFTEDMNSALRFDSSDPEPMTEVFKIDGKAYYGMYAGEIEKDGLLDFMDEIVISAGAKAGLYGDYMSGDLNFDGIIDTMDKVLIAKHKKGGIYSPVYYFEQ